MVELLMALVQLLVEAGKLFSQTNELVTSYCKTELEPLTSSANNYLIEIKDDFERKGLRAAYSKYLFLKQGGFFKAMHDRYIYLSIPNQGGLYGNGACGYIAQTSGDVKDLLSKYLVLEAGIIGLENSLKKALIEEGYRPEDIKPANEFQYNDRQRPIKLNKSFLTKAMQATKNTNQTFETKPPTGSGGASGSSAGGNIVTAASKDSGKGTMTPIILACVAVLAYILLKKK